MYEATFSARTKWYNIGLCLKLTSSTLDAIAVDYRTCEEQHRESLKEWLKKGHPTPRMVKLINALKNKIVRENRLARKLETKYPKREKSEKGKAFPFKVIWYSISMILFSSLQFDSALKK